jgi:hypothetical protein
VELALGEKVRDLIGTAVVSALIVDNEWVLVHELGKNLLIPVSVRRLHHRSVPLPAKVDLVVACYLRGNDLREDCEEVCRESLKVRVSINLPQASQESAEITPR